MADRVVVTAEGAGWGPGGAEGDVDAVAASWVIMTGIKFLRG